MDENERAKLQSTATDIVTRLIALGVVELGYDGEGGDTVDMLGISQDGGPPDSATHVLQSRALRAHGRLTDPGTFVVLKESLASLSETDALSMEARQTRSRLRQEGILEEIDGGVLEFAQDWIVPSASDGSSDVKGLQKLAKQVVLGSQGRRAGNWKPLST